MRRRSMLILLLAGFLTPVFYDPAVAGNVAGLRDTLTKGLRARRPQEFAFIDRVVAAVRNDKLKRGLVLGIFQWARKKARLKRKQPFPFFERAMRAEAAKRGVKL